MSRFDKLNICIVHYAIMLHIGRHITHSHVQIYSVSNDKLTEFSEAKLPHKGLCPSVCRFYPTPHSKK